MSVLTNGLNEAHEWIKAQIENFVSSYNPPPRRNQTPRHRDFIVRDDGDDDRSGTGNCYDRSNGNGDVEGKGRWRGGEDTPPEETRRSSRSQISSPHHECLPQVYLSSPCFFLFTQFVFRFFIYIAYLNWHCEVQGELSDWLQLRITQIWIIIIIIIIFS